MDLYTPDLPLTWSGPEEAKQTVVEEALLHAFNPFATLQTDREPMAKPRTVITYTVREGDTLSEIAQRYGISLKQLVEENRITNPHMVGIGLKLMIRRNEVVHTVKNGETLEQIARQYQVEKREIIRRNPLLKVLPDHLYVGQLVYVPLPKNEPMLAANPQLRKQMAQAASRSANRVQLMNWPVEGATITSTFGMRWGKMHKGVDLWKESKGNTPIQAARDGVVVEAGANRSGYGYMVVLDHGDGLQTFYAHMRKIVVHVGEQVESGQLLGYMGNTGDSTGYHLHFEVRQNDVPINPLRYLPH